MAKKDLNQKDKKSAFSVMEEEVLNFWEKNKIFEQSLDKESPQGDYIFYDGPPFATGLPHYGHFVASIMKDAVPRYWAMKGYHVDRRWGWDCHGLPVENLAEKEKGLKNRQDIEKLGVDNFNEYCESIVMRYANEWKAIIRRLGRWVDMENDYKTMNPDYMESIWWVFKALWEKNLIYKGYKPMHICPRCGTTLSNFEVGQGYKDIKDLSATVKFELEEEPGTYLLAWTTTPWTLIGNVALAVNKDVDYIKVRIKKIEGNLKINIKEGETYIFAKELTEKIWGGNLGVIEESKTGDKVINLPNGINIFFEEVANFYGKELVGKKYKPLFNYYSSDKNLENKENGWKIYAEDFVTTEEGTGIVHIAPAFGEDDMNLGQKYDLPFIQHVDMFGKFKPEVKDFANMEVKPKEDHMATDVEVIKYLAHHNLLFSKEKYEHSYPHCWRCETPLLNYAADSWFVKVTDIKKDLIKNNKNINWIPEHVKEGRFGKWLEQVRDWAISRNRYWGAPLPVWECEKCGERKVIGTRKELEEASGQKINDLHKQFVDKIVLPCSCGGEMHRIEEVLDCWFESGSMPYAQMSYTGKPLKNFDPVNGVNFPAQFIAEGIDQTRGWFYTLLVLSTALFNKEAFKNVIVNGIVLAEDGQKMSKSKGNYPDATLLFDKYGADALRLYLLSSPVMTAENINFSEEQVLEVYRKNIMLLWNVYKFYKMFAEGVEVNYNIVPDSDNVLDQWIVVRLNQLTNEITESMDNYNLPKATRPITDFIDDLSTWYIRRSRDRFKSNDKKDKKLALATTNYVLTELAKLMAPFTPFMAENLWQKVTGNNFKNKNKSVHLESWPKAGNIDEKILQEMEQIRKIIELGLAKRDEARIKVRQPLNELRIMNYELDKKYEDLIKDELNVKNVVSKKGNGNLEVELDTKITPKLKQEGIKREIVRFINALRKNAGFTINDKVIVYYETAKEDIKKSIQKYGNDIMKETLALELSENIHEADEIKDVKIEGEKMRLGIKKV